MVRNSSTSKDVCGCPLSFAKNRSHRLSACTTHATSQLGIKGKAFLDMAQHVIRRQLPVDGARSQLISP